jgi:hypothetical protein
VPVRASEDGISNVPVITKTSSMYKARTADTVGVTSFDWTHNGPMGGAILTDPLGGIHFGFTYRDAAGAAASRAPYYNYYNAASGGWLGIATVAAAGRWGTVGCKPTGEGLFAYYYTSGANYPNMIGVDAAPGLGLFDNYSVGPAATYAHPYLAVASADTMYVVSDGDLDEPMFTYSFDGGVTWASWADLSDGQTFTFPNYNIAAWHNKIAIVHMDSVDNVIYKESADYGATWGSWSTALANGEILANGDTIVPYIHPVCMYDASGNLYIADSYWEYIDDVTGTVPYDNGIVVWDATNGVKVAATKEIYAPTGWDQIGGSNVIACSWPWLAQAGDGTLVISYSMFDLADTSAGGYGNGELYAVKSTDGGASWSAATNISQTPAPGAADGACEDDRYPACAVLDDSVHFFWLCSKVAGSSIMGETAVSMDPQLHTAVALSEIGVAGSSKERIPSYKLALNQSTPNPARSIATISFSLPRAGDYSLRIYNIAGQLIRTLDGNGIAGQNTIVWNGCDNNGRVAANGVYLYNLKAEGKSATKKLTIVR